MKTKLCLLFVVVTLIAGFLPAPAQPKLGIAISNNKSVLSWPTNVSNYTLQKSTNAVPTGWLNVSNAPVTVSTNFTVTLTNLALTTFFRLQGSNSTPAAPAGMVLIPAGSFTIGNQTSDSDITDATPATVTVSAFYMETNLVTSNLWESVYTYAIGQGYDFDNVGEAKAGTHPILFVSWYDCVKWCNARSQQAGLGLVYFTDQAMTQPYENGETSVIYANWATNGYRLPTEAEWEKAARGGLTGQRFPWGNTITESLANYFGCGCFPYDSSSVGYNPTYHTGNSPFTSPVASFPANGYGLNDMTGNMSEWCWDWYAAQPYPTGSAYLGGTDPRGPTSGFVRVYRGGNWEFTADYARIAFRQSTVQNSAQTGIGFRCARSQ